MKITTFTKAFATLVLLVAVSSCAEDPLDDGDQTGKGHTITLRLSATVVPNPETKVTATPVRPGSEAEAAGFYSEMVSSDADRVVTPPGLNLKPMPPEKDSSKIDFATKALATKAPSRLKNAYALLFTSGGAFNGRAQIGDFTVGSPLDITFTKVVTTTATNCRLVMVANDASAATNYSSSTDFGTFTGTYADFQKLTITSAVNQDTDVPYAGSATVNLSQGEIAATAEVTLSWTLAKVTLKNHTFNITGGPARSSITLYNAGERRFATPGSDDYNGTGNTQTTAFVAVTAGSNSNSVTWYVGENIRPAGTGINSVSDRNSQKAPANACYIRVASATQSVGAVTSPKIGEEYTLAGTKSFTYDYYLGNSSILTDFSLRRHTNYTLNSSISGTLAIQEEIAAMDGRVTLTKTGGESAGLAIGMFGGASGYTQGATPPSITGSYTKLLLLEPNMSRTTATDNVTKQWSTNTSTQLQTETRKYWDHTYTSAHIETGAGFAYDYCYNLELGGVTKGTWYLPTHAQLLAMWSVWRGLQKNSSFANYSAFNANSYWSSTENNAATAWTVNFNNGYGSNNGNNKASPYRVRCVRDT